jgi:endonuclease YncB( thermonuclease family)
VGAAGPNPRRGDGDGLELRARSKAMPIRALGIRIPRSEGAGGSREAPGGGTGPSIDEGSMIASA